MLDYVCWVAKRSEEHSSAAEMLQERMLPEQESNNSVRIWTKLVYARACIMDMAKTSCCLLDQLRSGRDVML